ncbi:MAG: PQQ-like beta-propeller repeat protein [Acidobacteria bacterium]|nr:PQQ-like beta-propeller repeat protein [Acidobacteriota bacterium]MCI0718986.1 PQQ-like beta-propeller repeat protein [Acidobacteriota bacterium]
MRKCYAARLVVFGLVTWVAEEPVCWADWPGFRGPNASGVAETTGLPVEFGPKINVVWQTALPAGASSPVVTASRIFVTGAGERKLETICLDRLTGKILWRQAIAPMRSEALHQLNNPASPTPVTDGENVYAFFGDFGLVSYGPAGKERWRLPLGPFSNLHGMAASPILDGNQLYLVCDQDSDSYLLAIQKDSGKVLWKTARPEAVHGFATPSIFQPSQGPAQVIVPGSYQLTAYSVETGKPLWWVRGLTWQVKPTAVVNDDTIYVTGWAPGADAGERQNLPAFEEALKEGDRDRDGKLSPQEVPERLRHRGSWNAIDLGRDGFLDARDWNFYRARRSAQNVTMAIRPGHATGDLTETHVLWQIDRSVPVVSSPLLYLGVLYTIKDGGIFSALDPASGRIHRQARLPGAIDNYYASPVAADSKIFVVSETGKVSVVKAGKDWELLSLNNLNEPCYATPALAGSHIYLRTQTTLYCFGRP